MSKFNHFHKEERAKQMNLRNLDRLLNRLANNNKIAFRLKKIYLIINEGTDFNKEQMDFWFRNLIKNLNLIENVHYRYRIKGDVNSIYIRGLFACGLLLLTKGPNQFKAKCIWYKILLLVKLLK